MIDFTGRFSAWASMQTQYYNTNKEKTQDVFSR
jgi:hypothetical protein